MAAITWGTSGAPSDPPWTEIRAGLVQAANTLTSTTSFGLVEWNSTVLGLDQLLELAFATSSADIFNGQQKQTFRMAGIDNYVDVDWDDGRHSVTVKTRIGGSETTIYTVAVPANFLLGDIAKTTITVGGLVTLYQNGVSFGGVTLSGGDNTSLSGTTAGVGMRGASSDQGAWGAGNIDSLGGGGGSSDAFHLIPEAIAFQPMTGIH